MPYRPVAPDRVTIDAATRSDLESHAVFTTSLGIGGRGGGRQRLNLSGTYVRQCGPTEARLRELGPTVSLGAPRSSFVASPDPSRRADSFVLAPGSAAERRKLRHDSMLAPSESSNTHETTTPLLTSSVLAVVAGCLGDPEHDRFSGALEGGTPEYGRPRCCG